jgi:hypothetical protein
VQVFFESEKEHRAVLVLRGRQLSAALADTDPQEEGVPPLPARALKPEAEETARLLQVVLDSAFEVLRDEPAANAILARGIDAYHPFPTFEERYRLKARAIAKYPMYRGVARLVGMEARRVPDSDAEAVDVLARTSTIRLPLRPLQGHGLARRGWRLRGEGAGDRGGRRADPARRGAAAGRARRHGRPLDAVALRRTRGIRCRS